MKNPYLGLFTSIVAVSFASIFILSIEAHPLSIAFFRLLFTTIIIIPIVIFKRKLITEIKKLSIKQVVLMGLIGIILAAHFSLWITSLTKTSVASSVILVTAHPIIVGPLSYFFLKEKLSYANIIGILISVFGVVVLVYGNYGFASSNLNSLEGNILAWLGGVAAALYILGGRTLRRSVSVFPYALIVYSVGTITLFFICIFFQAPVYNLSIKDYEIIFLMALVSGILGHTLYNWSLEYVKASIASVFLLGEPIGSSILAFIIPWIHQEPSIYTMVGGGIILFGIYMTARKSYNQNLI